MPKGLTIARYPGQAILIGDGIRIILEDCQRGQARIRIEAPKDVFILREELEKKDDRGADPK